jgi:HTH-type transcriptional regulator/antitoxin HigA
MKIGLKYKIIRDKSQYYSYCDTLHGLLTSGTDPAIQDEIDLLTLLIESYDKQQHVSGDHDPITLLRSFMDDHQLAQDQLAAILHISVGHVSAILNYERSLSKVLTRKLAKHFKVRPEAFNSSYSQNKDQMDMKNQQTLSELSTLIRQARLTQNMTQQHLADKCGIARSYISKAENNVENVSVPVLRTIVEKGLGGQFGITFTF